MKKRGWRRKERKKKREGGFVGEGGRGHEREWAQAKEGSREEGKELDSILISGFQERAKRKRRDEETNQIEEEGQESRARSDRTETTHTQRNTHKLKGSRTTHKPNQSEPRKERETL